MIDAASAGASASISLVANIAANLIAFIALLHFLDATLTWFGNRVGIEELTFAVRWSVLTLMSLVTLMNKAVFAI